MLDFSEYLEPAPAFCMGEQSMGVVWDSLVETRDGDMPAGEIKPGTELLTSDGFEPVLENLLFTPRPSETRIINRGALGALRGTLVSSQTQLLLSHWALPQLLGKSRVLLVADQLPETHVQQSNPQKGKELLCQLITGRRVLISCDGLAILTTCVAERFGNFPRDTAPRISGSTSGVGSIPHLSKKGWLLLREIPGVFGKNICSQNEVSDHG